MGSEDKLRWDKLRSKGRARFILVRGGLMWGLPLGIVWNLVEFVRGGREMLVSRFFDEGLFMLCGFFLGGCLFSAYQWNSYENKYRSTDSPDFDNP